MKPDAVIAWMAVGVGAIQAAAAIRERRAGRPGSQAASGVMSIVFGISLLTSGWVRAVAWAVMAVYGVGMTVHFVQRLRMRRA